MDIKLAGTTDNYYKFKWKTKESLLKKTQSGFLIMILPLKCQGISIREILILLA